MLQCEFVQSMMQNTRVLTNRSEMWRTTVSFEFSSGDALSFPVKKAAVQLVPRHAFGKLGKKTVLNIVLLAVQPTLKDANRFLTNSFRI